MRLLPAGCFTKGWSLSSPTTRGSVAALPLVLFAIWEIPHNHGRFCHCRSCRLVAVAISPPTSLVLFLFPLQQVLLDPPPLFLMAWKVWSWGLSYISSVPLAWCCPVAALVPGGLCVLPGAAFKWHLNKKLSSLISSLLLCHWAEDRVPISFTRTPGHKTLGLFLTSNQGALIKETVTSFMSLLA